MKSAWKLFDTDGNGEITIEEMAQTFDKLNEDLSEQDQYINIQNGLFAHHHLCVCSSCRRLWMLLTPTRLFPLSHYCLWAPDSLFCPRMARSTGLNSCMHFTSSLSSRSAAFLFSTFSLWFVNISLPFFSRQGLREWPPCAYKPLSSPRCLPHTIFLRVSSSPLPGRDV